MAGRKVQKDSIEILYIERSSRDGKGRRVLIRQSNVENWVHQGDTLTDLDIKLWELSPEQQQEITTFLGAGGAHGEPARAGGVYNG